MLVDSSVSTNMADAYIAFNKLENRNGHNFTNMNSMNSSYTQLHHMRISAFVHPNWTRFWNFTRKRYHEHPDLSGYITLSLLRVINFSCGFTRSITSHSMENLAFHRLLIWKMIILPILPTSLIHFLSNRLGECKGRFKSISSIWSECSNDN